MDVDCRTKTFRYGKNSLYIKTSEHTGDCTWSRTGYPVSVRPESLPLHRLHGTFDNLYIRPLTRFIHCSLLLQCGCKGLKDKNNTKEFLLEIFLQHIKCFLFAYRRPNTKEVNLVGGCYLPPSFNVLLDTVRGVPSFNISCQVPREG